MRSLLLLTLCSILLPGTPCQLRAQDARDRFAIPNTDAGLPGAGPIRRYDWFRNLWQNRRSAWAKQVQQDRGAVVFLGDSITQGWGPKMGDSFPGVKVANRGISGDTTRGMLIRLQDDVLALEPAAVVILAGTNDLEEGAAPEVIAGNMRLILQALTEHNAKIPIVLCQVFPSSASKKRPAEAIQKINTLCQHAAREFPQVTVLDTWTLFANKNGDAIAEEFPDLLHPNQAGYAKWAAALHPILATLGFVDTTPDDFVCEPGFEMLFNGKDLTGWGLRPTTQQQRGMIARWRKNNANAPAWPIVEESVSFDGKASSPDGRYRAINGRLVVTTPAEGRRVQQLWTTREFGEDFVLKLEFRATPNADSGVFVRGPQLQCRDYPLAGPYKDLTRYRPQDWNELVINVKDGKARCTCNGEVLEEEFRVPPKGPIGLEGDRGQLEYRRIRIGKDDGNLLNATNSVCSWTFETSGDGAGEIATQGDAIVFTTSRTDDTDWHVQAYQPGLSLREGGRYRVSFDLKSPQSATVVLLAMINVDDYHTIGVAEEIYAEPTYQTHQLEFTATDVKEGQNRIGFVLGRDKGTVFVRNFRLVAVD